MSTPFVLKSLRLVNYKGFADHRITFRHTNLLVGANNAGNTTWNL